MQFVLSLPALNPLLCPMECIRPLMSVVLSIDFPSPYDARERREGTEFTVAKQTFLSLVPLCNRFLAR